MSQVSVSLLIQILLIAMTGATALIYLMFRIYVMAAGGKIRTFCKKEVSDHEKNDYAEGIFHTQRLEDFCHSGRNLALALIISFFVLILLWFFGTAADIKACRLLITPFQITACAAFVISLITGFSISASLPGSLGCYPQVRTAVRKYNVRFLLIAILYTAVQWMYSLT